MLSKVPFSDINRKLSSFYELKELKSCVRWIIWMNDSKFVVEETFAIILDNTTINEKGFSKQDN